VCVYMCWHTPSSYSHTYINTRNNMYTQLSISLTLNTKKANKQCQKGGSTDVLLVQLNFNYIHVCVYIYPHICVYIYTHISLQLISRAQIFFWKKRVLWRSFLFFLWSTLIFLWRMLLFFFKKTQQVPKGFCEGRSIDAPPIPSKEIR